VYSVALLAYGKPRAAPVAAAYFDASSLLPTAARMKRTSWTPVVVFFLIAVAISAPFFYWRTVLDWKGFAGPNFLKTTSYMWGPGIAGLVCYALYRRRFVKRITLWGFSFWKSLLVWVGPFLLLAALGLRTPDGGLDRTLPLMLLGFGVLTIVGEEVGWRWFLQDYLQRLHPLKKYIVVGVLWELWHLRFLGKLGQPVTAILITSVVVMLITVAVSIVIGYVTDRTRSLLFAVALHGWVDMCLEFPQRSTYVCAAVTVVLCAVFVFAGKTRDKNLLVPLPERT